MSDKFKNIPVEKDTKIIISSPMKLGESDIVYQKWSWEGITAESIIFISSDVENVGDAELKYDIYNSPIVHKDSEVTISRGDEYTFVNFNFKA